jgi:hypothetical protein
MIRRYFLRFLALSPLAGLAAVQPARGETAARAAWPAAIYKEDFDDFDASDPLYWSALLGNRMRICMSIRAKLDDLDARIIGCFKERTARVGHWPKWEQSTSDWVKDFNKEYGKLQSLKGQYAAASKELAAIERLLPDATRSDTDEKVTVPTSAETEWRLEHERDHVRDLWDISNRGDV